MASRAVCRSAPTAATWPSAPSRPTSDTSLSADGRYVAFASTATNLSPVDRDADADAYVRDTVAGTTTVVSMPDPSLGIGRPAATASLPRISADGRFVAFASTA